MRPAQTAITIAPASKCVSLAIGFLTILTGAMNMRGLSRRILDYAATLPEATPLCPANLVHVGNLAAVDQALARLARSDRSGPHSLNNSVANLRCSPSVVEGAAAASRPKTFVQRASAPHGDLLPEASRWSGRRPHSDISLIARSCRGSSPHRTGHVVLPPPKMCHRPRCSCDRRGSPAFGRL